MQNKSLILVAIVVVAVGGALFFSSQNKGGMSVPPAGQGKAVIGISDGTTDIKNVTSIVITVDKVEVQTAGQGWTTVSNGTKTYDLLQLKQTGAVALLADVNLPVGTYDQIQLTISKVEVTAGGKVQEAKLPSGTLKIAGRLVVEDGKTATAVLDFKADKSLHETGNGQFILAPVVNIQTKSDASVNEQSDETLKIEGGKSEDDKNVGMDEHGDIKDNFELDASATIQIDAHDMIHAVSPDGSENENQKQDSGAIQSGGVNVKIQY